MAMEKYGVCKECYQQPKDVKDLEENFEKTSCGDYKCPACGQLMFKALNLEDSISVDDKESEK